MKTPRRLFLSVCSALLVLAAQAADISGQWRGEVDTPMGRLKLLFTFQADGEKLSGKSASDLGGEKRESTLKDVKLAGDTLTFAEKIEMQDNAFQIDYVGKVAANEIKFARKIGDFGNDEMIATRVAAEKAAPTTPPPTSAPEPGRRTTRGPDGRERVIQLGADDKRAFPDAPASFNEVRADIPHGKNEMIEYDSKTVGTRRKMLVYTPPGYSTAKKYPVLYLLHGIGGDETEWQRFATPHVILDNLLADGKLVPMIVVMPNGRARKDDRSPKDLYGAEHAAAFAAFERDLLDDVIPAIEARYSVQADREHRALAGLSMGGGQTLNFGLSHLDTFAWIGAFSPAPNTNPPAQLVPDPAAATQKLKLFYLSCGNKDGLLSIAQGLHAYLKERGVPHLWNVDDYAHDSPHWRNNLYHFSQHLFR